LAFGAGQAAAPSQIRLTYLGTAGWEITDGNVVVMVDPYLTRAKYGTPNDAVSPDDPRPTVGNSTVVPSDTAVIDQHITRASVIVVTHSHPDHALDVPYIATKTGAVVVGTESTANLARASGVPEAQLKIVSGTEELTFPGVTIRVIPSLHGIFSPPRPNAPAPVPPKIPRDIKPPFRYADHQEGGTLAYLIRIGGHEIIVFGSMNFIESEITGLRPDIALIGGMPERQYIDDYTGRIMRALGNPRTVLPTHWDQFNVPYGFSQQHAVDRVQSFVAEIKAVSPNTRVIVPEHFKPIVLAPEGPGLPRTDTRTDTAVGRREPERRRQVQTSITLLPQGSRSSFESR
jgi:L-ascorbate metabolism protein UlaG (beta-lactamase superfamily)